MISASLNKDLPLYEALLGPAWNQLAPAVQRAHRVRAQLDIAGHFDILRGSGLLARLLLPLAGMPPAGKAVPTRLRMIRLDQREEWRRSFGTFPLNSVQHLHDVGLLAERFGRLEVRFKVEVRPAGYAIQQETALLHQKRHFCTYFGQSFGHFWTVLDAHK